MAEYTALAGVAWLMSTVFYALNFFTDTDLAIALGDALMVLAPGLIWVALRIVNVRAWSGLLLAVTLPLTVYVLGLLIPLPPAAAVKLLAMAGFSIAVFFEARQTPLSALPGTRMIAFTAVTFAMLLGLRLVIEVFRGADGADLFATRRLTIAGIVVFIFVTIGVVRLLRALSPTSTQPGISDGSPEGSSAVVFSIENFTVVRVGRGSSYARTIQDALFDAVEDYLVGSAQASSHDDGRVIAIVPPGSGLDCETSVRPEFALKVERLEATTAIYSEPLILTVECHDLSTPADVTAFVRDATATRFRPGR
ncbi:hypothetical protein FHX48_001952 [Microbacterium halimionae]|uniref:Uncharacterized protein n=1 Tax=Microbacterium halimionae TaxID=1526413 RepID=A0A7W3JQ10_9MICO|nr:hypothetical protein [Microbacterium halimionae]MBA8816859.1 hypothetical protein [Microbacterium halimionae]NII94845.1 hypothetical protein [Microbacterium halimionae]